MLNSDALPLAVVVVTAAEVRARVDVVAAAAAVVRAAAAEVVAARAPVVSAVEGRTRWRFAKRCSGLACIVERRGVERVGGRVDVVECVGR